MDPWTQIVRCAACWELDIEWPLTSHGDHLFCSACREAGRRRVSASEEQLRSAWTAQLRRLHLDRLALAAAEPVLSRRNARQAERYVSLADALDELQALTPDEHVLLLDALVHHAFWDGVALRVVWRQPFDLFVNAIVAIGADPTDAEVDALVMRWAERAGDRLAEVLTEVLPSGRDGRKTKQDRLRQLGPCNMLTVNDAIAELGMGKDEGKEWLEAKGLVHHPGRPRRGSGRVIVSELIEALKSTRGRPGSRRLAPTKLPLPKTDRF